MYYRVKRAKSEHALENAKVWNTQPSTWLWFNLVVSVRDELTDTGYTHFAICKPNDDEWFTFTV
jgi:predicted DCC family thiol-disulfide oxidoreductase YuxK